jgi:hypothetical protein
MTSMGISHALHKNCSAGINLSGSFNGFALRGLVITDSVGVRPPNYVITLFFPPFNKQLAGH